MSERHWTEADVRRAERDWRPFGSCFLSSAAICGDGVRNARRRPRHGRLVSLHSFGSCEAKKKKKRREAYVLSSILMLIFGVLAI